MLEYNEEAAYLFTQRIMESCHDPLLQFWRLSPHPAHHVAHLFRMIENKYKSIYPEKVLDLGCGTGQFLHLLLTLEPGIEAVGVNFFQSQISMAMQDHGGKLTLKQGDINTYSDTNKYDLIFSNYTMGHLDSLDRMASLVHELLTDDGVFVAWDIAPTSITDKTFYGYHMRTPAEVFKGFDRFICTHMIMDDAVPMKGAAEAISQRGAEDFECCTLPVLYVFWKRRK